MMTRDGFLGWFLLGGALISISLVLFGATDAFANKRLVQFVASTIPTNVTISDNQVVAAETNRVDGFANLVVVNLNNFEVSRVPSSGGVLYVLANGPQVLASDPFEDQVVTFDVTSGREITRRATPFLEGPWELVIDSGLLYGSNRAGRLITRFDLKSQTPLLSFPVQVGGGDIAITGSRIYLHERAFGNPRDAVALYSQTDGAFVGRVYFPGRLARTLNCGASVCTAVKEEKKLYKASGGEFAEVVEFKMTPIDMAVGGNLLIVLQREGSAYRLTAFVMRGERFIFKGDYDFVEGDDLVNPYRLAVVPQEGTVVLRDEVGLFLMKDGLPWRGELKGGL